MALTTISASGLDTYSDVGVAFQADGGFVVSWEGQTRGPLTSVPTDTDPTDTDPNAILSEGVYVQRFGADGQSVAGPVLVTSETGSGFDVTERRTSVAASPDGGTLIAYLSATGSASSPDQIVVTTLDANLTASSVLVTISAAGLDTISDVDVASQGDGGFVVSWEGQTRGPLVISPTDTDPAAILSQGVYVQRFGPDGQPTTGAVLVASETGSDFDTTERRASVAILPDGGTLVAYLSAPDSVASPNQIVIAMLDAGLASTLAPITISASGLNTFSDVDVASQADGGFVVSWERQTRGPVALSPTETDPDGILFEGAYIQRFGANGQPITSPVLLSSETGSSFAVTERGVGISTSSDGGTLVAYLSAPGSASDPDQIVVADATNIAIACFVAGTRIATLRGMVLVEQLQVGNTAIVASGDHQIIQWIGNRHIDCRRQIDPRRVWPVRIAPHAFGEGRPWRSLLLSPDHAVFVEDVLIPIKFLLNDSTIVQLRVDTIDYYHVELERHDILLADGLPTESYLETGGRAAFANAETSVQLHPEFAPDVTRVGMVWRNFACAPLLGDSGQLARARMKLQWQAAMIEDLDDAAGCVFVAA